MFDLEFCRRAEFSVCGETLNESGQSDDDGRHHADHQRDPHQHAEREPARSSEGQIKIPPRDRMMNEIPKEPNVSGRDVFGSFVGKNSSAIVTSNAPWTMTSNYSKPVTNDAATTALRAWQR